MLRVLFVKVEDTILSISSSAAALMNTGDIIILTGIKFGKAGRE